MKETQKQVGIDAISFYVPPFYLDLKLLAQEQRLPPEKFYQTTGQYSMAVCSPDEDIVTMGASAAVKILKDIDLHQIEMLLFATETGIDQSKAAGIYVHKLLDLPKNCRVVELKQACYSATAALQLANAWLQQNPDKKVLLIASDIARYELQSTAETSQGAGAVAMLLTSHPRLIALEPECGIYVDDVMDFWRPDYTREAFVDGKLSCDTYIKTLIETWRQYNKHSQRQFDDHAVFCYHTPIPRLVENAHKKLARFTNKQLLSPEQVNAQIGASLTYSRQIGNCYTASLYLGVTSLLETFDNDLSEKRIGFYSYGSGCSGEFFSGIVQPDYQHHLHKNYHHELLNCRKALSYSQYLHYYHSVTDQTTYTTPFVTTGQYRFAGLEHHQRQYCLNKNFQTFDLPASLRSRYT